MNRLIATYVAGIITVGLWPVAQPTRETIDAPARPIQSGDTISFPAGEHTLTAPITVTHGQDVRIVGAGPGQTILTYAGPANGCAIDLVSCYGCRIEGIEFRSSVPGATAIRYRTAADTAGKVHPSRNVLDNVRFAPGKHPWRRCVDVDSHVAPGRDNNQDFYRFSRCVFVGYVDCGLRVNGSQAKGWALDQCEFYGGGTARVGLHLAQSGSGVLTNNYFGDHTFASIHGESLWAGDSLVITGGTTEARSGESLLSVSHGGYPFPTTITGYCWRGTMPKNRGIIEYAKAGHLAISNSVFWIQDGYTGQPLVRCFEMPGSGAGSVSVRSCEFMTGHPQPVARKSILAAPKSWAVDWFGVTARSLNPPGPWNSDPVKNPHRSHHVSAADGRLP